MNLIDFLEQRIYPSLDRALVFSRLNPIDKGTYYLLNCPRCQKREAYIYKEGFTLQCNRLNQCGHSESIIQYVAQSHNVRGRAFFDGVKALADMLNITIPKIADSSIENDQIRLNERKNQLLEAIIRFAKISIIDHGNTATHYLYSRGLSDITILLFEIGYLPKFFAEKLTEYLKRLDFQSQEIESSGIYADARLESRIIGPWRNKHGRIETIWARSIETDQIPKYLYLKNGKKSCPFGINKSSGKDLIVVEGIFDMISLHQAGIKDVVALGGATFNKAQLDYLTKINAKSLTVNFDYDPDDKICSKVKDCAYKLLSNQIDIYFINPISMTNGEINDKIDPDNFIKTHSVTKYQNLLEQAKKPHNFLTELILKNLDLTSDRSIDNVLDELDDISNRLDKSSADDIWKLLINHTGWSEEYFKTKRSQRKNSKEGKAKKNTLTMLLSQSISEIKNGSIKEAVTTLVEKLEQFKPTVGEIEIEPFLVDQCLGNIKNAPSGKKTGWPPLDNLDIKLMPQELTIIGGRTGHGKTTALFSLLLNWLLEETEEQFLLFSYELPKEAICIKLISTLTRHLTDYSWSYNEIIDYLQGKERSNRFPNPNALNEALAKLRSFEKRLQVIYQPAWDIDDLCIYAASHAMEKGILSAILVDYLQLIPPPAKRVERRDLEVSLVSRKLKNLAVSLSCPVIAAAQIGRQAVSDAGRIPHDKYLDDEAVQNAIKKRRPQLHHLREGGSEQEADLILGLLNYQADFLENNDLSIFTSTDKGTPFEINVIKNRFGRLGIGNMIIEANSGYIRQKAFRDQ